MRIKQDQKLFLRKTINTLLPDADNLLNIRELRNQIAHEYVIDDLNALQPQAAIKTAVYVRVCPPALLNSR